jgi:uncharacterized protein with FMN-binding domain
MRRVLLAACSTVVLLVLLLGFKTQSTSKPLTSPPSLNSGTSGSSGSAGTVAGTTGTKTATGEAADTRYGPVQVKVTVSNGKITAAEAIDYPNQDPRDQEINSFAIPQLEQEAISASSAKIDVVSGATYTSEGYVQSLQSALDQIKN